MSTKVAFEPGSLKREIAIRGMSIEAFAEKAGVDVATVARADLGNRLRPETIGKIVATLGSIPVIDGPVDLVKTA